MNVLRSLPTQALPPSGPACSNTVVELTIQQKGESDKPCLTLSIPRRPSDHLTAYLFADEATHQRYSASHNQKRNASAHSSSCSLWPVEPRFVTATCGDQQAKRPVQTGMRRAHTGQRPLLDQNQPIDTPTPRVLSMHLYCRGQALAPPQDTGAFPQARRLPLPARARRRRRGDGGGGSAVP